MITNLLTFALLGTLALGCAHHRSPDDSAGASEGGGSGKVSGTVAYRERIALAPDAVVHVTLEDVSRADAPSVRLGETTIRPEGRQVPIPFEIAYDPAKIVDSHTYAVRATIRDAAGALQWTSTQAYPVLTRGAGDRVDVAVQRTGAGASPRPAAARATGTLEGPTWVLESFEEGGGSRAVPEGVRITARFEDGMVSGSSGCNRFHGPYRVEAGKPTFGPLATTRMACPEPESSHESAFLAAMASATVVSVQGDRMTVTHERGALSFREEPPAKLPGSSWTITGYNNGKHAVVSSLQGTAPTIEFGDGTVSGSTGCNAFTGPYQVDGEALTFGRFAVTQKMCVKPEGIMEQEAQLLAALAEAAGWTIDGDHLDLYRADRGRLVSAQRR